MHVTTGIRAAMLTVFVFAACVGKGSAQGTDLNRFLGTWRSICDRVNSAESEQATITISKGGAGLSQLNFTNRMAVYEGTECSGAPVVGTTTGTFTFNGKKQVGSASVDKVVVRVTKVEAPNAQFVPRDTKDLLTIINSRLYSGNVDKGAPRDGDGYPNGLWMDFPSTKR
jgi:hypothetical protein